MHFRGCRFDEFQQSLGMSPTLLARRLKDLVAHGILYKERYQTRPMRYHYLLTGAAKIFSLFWQPSHNGVIAI